jgi:hypothetical protein
MKGTAKREGKDAIMHPLVHFIMVEYMMDGS